MTFAMPNVKVGSIIEYEYESTMEHYGGLQDWYFQSDIPVIRSHYNIYVVPSAEFTYLVRRTTSFECKIDSDPRNARVSFEMQNIPGLREEAFSTSNRDYLQRIDFQLSAVRMRSGAITRYTTTWNLMTKELLEDKLFGATLDKKLSISGEIQSGVANLSGEVEKMEYIHNYIRKNFAWNKIDSKYAYDGLKHLVDKKKGNTAELNLLMINLLRMTGITAYPMLVSERSHGRVDTSYPIKDQFNKVVAYVNASGKYYILDATDLYTPVGVTPFDLLNTQGFVVDKKAGGFVTINDGGRKKSYFIHARNNIGRLATITGEASVDYIDYARIGKAEKYKTNKDGYLVDFLKASPAIKIDSFTISNLESDSLALNHRFLINQSLNKSGGYYLLNYNLLTGFEKNPFVADYRFTNIDFGSKYFCVVTNNFVLPDNMMIESIPKDSKIATVDNSLVALRQIKQEGNEIMINLRIEFNDSEFPAEDYPVIKEFFRKMIDMLNEPVLLKSK